MRRAAFQFAAGFGCSPSNALRWKSSPMTAGCPLLLFRNIQVIILCTPFLRLGKGTLTTNPAVSHKSHDLASIKMLIRLPYKK